MPPLQRVARKIKRLQHRHHREIDTRLGALGTTLSQWDALRHVAEHPDSSTHDLAVRTFMTDQSFGALAIRLADLGLVERLPGPGRAVRHRITAAGKQVLDRAAAVVDGVVAESFAPLDEDEVAQLDHLLTKLLGPERTG
ncbi:MarR family winged helix-turn-helix transcriptional regulator [Actinokineospora bangkokensis]|uniref:MarR family transcriptional regulator n=1 Tax=Actinokineospora bangkokensis TaxID=1193682 RepID=A0A1Q9LP05_9PSEU|nr:MarR family winged helix-turn-helix transcriptional regulator [Actinokineospora bangkokensis]OLR93724.1 MarR family transcriptional regulator [Actinokineospora bangkokensis]